MVAVPKVGEFLPAFTAFSAVFTAVISAATGTTVTNEVQMDTTKKANWFTKFLDGKGKWLKDRMDKFRMHMQNFTQRMIQFNKFMIMIARFMPIIKVFIAIIIIFSDLLKYVILIIAYIAIAIVHVVYFIVSLPPFIYVFFIIYFLIVECIPFVIYTMLFLALLIFITAVCLLMAVLNFVTGGKLSKIVLCQNGPSSWYKTPNYHLSNRYSRGLFCSKPCRKGYYPDPTGTSCIKLPKGTPPYCPQASLLRLYTGEGKKDKLFAYRDFKTKSNMRHLMKTPDKREDDLMAHFKQRSEHYDKCENPANPFSTARYASLTRNICANLEALKSSTTLGKYTPKDIKKMELVCAQAFCDSRASYPFCHKLTKVSEVDFSDLIKKIIIAIIAMIVFSLTVMFTIAYINEI
jgi:hypothetical protein